MAEVIKKTTYKDDVKNISQANLPWEKLSNTNILVTGATGLIGSCLIDALMAFPGRSYHVYALGRNVKRASERFNPYYKDSHFHFIQHDVTVPLQGDTQFDYIIHAASNASPHYFRTAPVEIIKSNTIGVSNLMEYGISHGMRRFLYVSTGEIYGEGDGRIFTEDYNGYVNITNPRSCYPSSKRAAETLCVSYMTEYGANVVIARPCHVYGPHFTESDNRVYAQFIRNILNGEDIIMKSTGEQYRSWCYVVDCITALLHLLLKGEKGEAYNIADSYSNITIKQLAEMIAHIGNRHIILDIPSDTEKRSFNPVSKSVFSTKKLEQLGWSITGTMEEKIRKTIEEMSNKVLNL